MAANPRLDLPVVVDGMLNLLLLVRQPRNVVLNGRFTMLMEVRKRL
jgi:hypothetical protein